MTIFQTTPLASFLDGKIIFFINKECKSLCVPLSIPGQLIHLRIKLKLRRNRKLAPSESRLNSEHMVQLISIPMRLSLIASHVIEVNRRLMMNC